MCDGQRQGPGQRRGEPASVTQALGLLHQALDHLAAADAASLPSSVQAEVLRGLEQAVGKQVAARSRVLAAFAGQAAYEADGQRTARTWLAWQARITTGAAAGAVGWARRLACHPVIADALAAGDLSESWARQVCAWTDRLSPARQDAADEILAAAARAGVDLPGLAGLAQEMYERAYQGRGEDVPDGFGGRAVFLDTTLGGAGRLTGDLTAGCAAALTAVLESLGKRAGPEDIRSAAQRRHDALEEACRRLIATGMLPGRAGQPTQIQLHMTLSQLRDLPGASAAEAAWAAARAGQPGWVSGPDAEAAACDATVVPIVTGHLDPAALDHLTDIYLAAHGSGAATHADGAATHAERAAGHPGGAAGQPGGTAGQPGGTAGGPGAAGGTSSAAPPVSGTGSAKASAAGGAGSAASGAGGVGAGVGGEDAAGVIGDEAAQADGPASQASAGAGGAGGTCAADGQPGGRGCRCGRGDRPPAAPPPPEPLSPPTRARLRRALLALATDTLAGPGGLAAHLRAGLDGPLAAVSLPLDIGPATETIPAHLRRAVTTRHPHCAFPGCAQPATVCEIHHIIPRSRGGPTALHNLVTLCVFHHKIAVHRWGWHLRLNTDGTTTATGPGGQILHSHSPPSQAA